MNDRTRLCQYMSKECLEPRAQKENGDLHQLCEFHRAKANEAQQRWYARHQQGTVELKPRVKTKSIPATNPDKETIPMTAESSTAKPFSEEELALLDEILYAEEETEQDVGMAQAFDKASWS